MRNVRGPVFVGRVKSNSTKPSTMDPLNLVEKSKGFIKAFEASDVEKMQSYWADGEAMYRMPYASGMFPDVAQGKDGFYELTKDWPDIFESIDLDIVEVILDEKE